MPESARGGLSGRKPRDAALLLEAMIALRTKRATGPRAIAHPVIAIAIAANAECGRDTVVLLTADHGESFDENDHYFKHTHATTPESARVPLIIRTPGLAPGYAD
jgi:hypothetical protein